MLIQDLCVFSVCCGTHLVMAVKLWRFVSSIWNYGTLIELHQQQRCVFIKLKNCFCLLFSVTIFVITSLVRYLHSIYRICNPGRAKNFKVNTFTWFHWNDTHRKLCILFSIADVWICCNHTYIFTHFITSSSRKTMQEKQSAPKKKLTLTQTKDMF